MEEPAIEFFDVSLRFRQPERRFVSLKEFVIQSMRNRMVWLEREVLSGVSFRIDRGTTFGIVGANGAGKSTLLRVASGILTPTEGRAVMRGRLAPIIELGTGFEHELTGRENIFFNGALLGRSQREMEARFNDIVQFSGLGDYIDAPLRTYSTGMTARLAFAIATTVDPDILLLDEVLAVGDEEFRRRCEHRIDSFRDRGVTILLVSHALELVESVCDQSLWLRQGKVQAIGPSAEVIAQYRASLEPAQNAEAAGA